MGAGSCRQLFVGEAALWARSGHGVDSPCHVTRGWVRELWVLPRGWVTPRGPQGWVGRQPQGSAWCHPRVPRVSLGLSPAVGTQHGPRGGYGELQPRCCVPPSVGRVRASPWPRRGCRPPGPMGCCTPRPQIPLPSGSVSWKANSIPFCEEEKKNTVGMPLALGMLLGGVYALPGTLVHSTLILGTKCQS